MPDFKPIEHARYFIHGPRQFKPNRIPFRQCRDLFSSILFATYFFVIHSCIPVIPEQPFKSIRCHKPWHDMLWEDSIRFRTIVEEFSFLGKKNSPQTDSLLFNQRATVFFFINIVKMCIYLGINKWNIDPISWDITQLLNQRYVQKFRPLCYDISIRMTNCSNWSLTKLLGDA